MRPERKRRDVSPQRIGESQLEYNARFTRHWNQVTEEQEKERKEREKRGNTAGQASVIQSVPLQPYPEGRSYIDDDNLSRSRRSSSQPASVYRSPFCHTVQLECPLCQMTFYTPQKRYIHMGM
eukprot:5027293-Amphidinium_carterae.2